MKQRKQILAKRQAEFNTSPPYVEFTRSPRHLHVHLVASTFQQSNNPTRTNSKQQSQFQQLGAAAVSYTGQSTVTQSAYHRSGTGVQKSNRRMRLETESEQIVRDGIIHNIDLTQIMSSQASAEFEVNKKLKSREGSRNTTPRRPVEPTLITIETANQTSANIGGNDSTSQDHSRNDEKVTNELNKNNTRTSSASVPPMSALEESANKRKRPNRQIFTTTPRMRNDFGRRLSRTIMQGQNANPLIGPKGTFDLKTVLNATLESSNVTTTPALTSTNKCGISDSIFSHPIHQINNHHHINHQQNNLSSSQQSYFNKRAASQQPNANNNNYTPAPLDSSRLRSQSTARSNTTGTGYQTFQSRSQIKQMTLNSDLIKKIRLGVYQQGISGISGQTKQRTEDLAVRRRAMQRAAAFAQVDQQNTTIISETMQNSVIAASEQAASGQIFINPLASSINSTTSSQKSRDARRSKLDSQRQFDYCPDEDSDNDIITQIQNCAPGFKPPEPKPNDPTQMHTWRQVNSIADNYITKLERKTEILESITKKKRSIIDDSFNLSPFEKQENQEKVSQFKTPDIASPSSKSDRSVTFRDGMHNYSTRNNLQQQTLQLQQQSLVQQPKTSDFKKRKATADQKLRVKPYKPKFSLEFNKWIDDQKNEDPQLLAEVNSMLTPKDKRNPAQQTSVDFMAILARRQQQKQKFGNFMSQRKPVIPILNPNLIKNAAFKESTNKQYDSLAMLKIDNIEKIDDRHKNPILTQRFTPMQVNKLNLDGSPQKVAEENGQKATVSKRLTQHTVDESGSIRQSHMQKVQSQDDNRIAVHLTEQKKLIFKSNNFEIQPHQQQHQRQLNVECVDADSSMNNPSSTSRSGSKKTKHDQSTSSKTDKMERLVTENEAKYNKQLFRVDSMVTHFRRVKIFNETKKELDKMKIKVQEEILSGDMIARRTLRIMLGTYWRDFFRKLRNKHTGQTMKEDLKQSEEEARQAVLQRLNNMMTYVGDIEDLIRLNPISRRKLCDEAVTSFAATPGRDEADEITTLSIMKQVIINKLEEANSEIIAEQEQRMAKMEEILRQFGSVDAYKEYVAEIKKQAAEDMASLVEREQARKAQEEAEKRKKNQKNSIQNQMRVARWMGNYEQKTVEIIETEIDLINEMEQEENMAALCLIQDDAVDEENAYLIQRENMDNLISTINQEVKQLKKTLKFDKTQKSGKLGVKDLHKQEKSAKKQKKKDDQKQQYNIETGQGNIIQDNGRIDDPSSIQMTDMMPNISVEDSSDFDRDSLNDSDDDDSSRERKSRRSARRGGRQQSTYAQSQHYLASQGTSSDSSSSSSIRKKEAFQRESRFNRTRRTGSVLTGHTGQTGRTSQTDQTNDLNNSFELRQQERKDLKKMRDKRHNKTLKQLKKQTVFDLTEMENRLYELQEIAEDKGLDALLGQQAKSKNDSNNNMVGFDAEQTLTHKLDELFDTTAPSKVKWDDDELKDREEQKKAEQKVAQESALSMGRRQSVQMSKMSQSQTQAAFMLTRKEKPKAVQVFEATCKSMNENVPAIFKQVKNGNFELKEITLTAGQTYALGKAAQFFGNFADKVRLENNNLTDQDMSDIITSLAMIPALKKLSVARNEFGEQTLNAMKQLLAKRFPNNLAELTIEGIKLKPQLTTNLMNSLNSSNLRKLQLIQLNMTDESFNQFVEYVRKCQLEELDLRDSKVTAAQFLTMLEVLKGNKQLKWLNLSHNNLVSAAPSQQNNNGNVTGLEVIAEESNRGSQAFISPQQNKQNNEANLLNNQQAQIVECLGRFIRRNKQLVHVNLESTGLTFEMIKSLLVSVKKSRSLQAIHLCGNPGLNEIELIHYTVDLLNPINFSQWDDIAVAGQTSRQSKMKRSMHSAMTNNVINRASQVPSRAFEYSNNPSSRDLQSAMLSPNTRRAKGSQMNLKGVFQPQTPNVQGRNVGGILKQPTTFEDAAARANSVAGAADLSDLDSDEAETRRKNQPSAIDLIHSGLKTKSYMNKMKQPSMKMSNKFSSRLEVFHQERTGRKSVSFQQMKESVQLMNYKKFILTRFVGHKSTMEHGHRWRLYLEQNKNATCWICEKWNYTMFFWTRPFGEKDQVKITSTQLQDFEEKKRCMELFVPEKLKTNQRGFQQQQQKSKSLALPQSKHNSRPPSANKNSEQDMLNPLEKAEHFCPIFTGSFNGWEEPSRMIRVKEFSHFMDRKKTEFFQQLKRKGLIAREANKYQELSEKDKKVYQEHKQNYIDTYEPEKWKLTMAQMCKYRKPGLVNLFEMDTHMSPEVWVTAAFVKPGTHTYVVADYRGEKQYHHANIHECNVDKRIENIAPYERITKLKSGDVFNRWKTIFAQWPNETEQTFRQCIDHDIKLWKVTRLIKEQDDYNDVIRVLLKNAKLLTHLFMYLSSKSVFPAIGQMDFGSFCADSHIVDAKFILSTVDRQFIAATTANPNQDADPKLGELKKQATKAELLKLQPDSAMVRYQFIEILVRIAGAKYKGQTYQPPFQGEPEQVETYSRALEVLIEHNILSQYDFESPESIRFGKLWKNDVAGIFKANQGLLQDLFKKMHKKRKYMSMDDTYAMVEKIHRPEQAQQTGISLKEFNQIYGMSKLVCVEESHKGLGYLRTKFLEMVELIGRLTIYKNFNTQMEDLPLYKQVQLTMDELFEMHLGVLGFDLGGGGDSDGSSGESEDDY